MKHCRWQSNYRNFDLFLIHFKFWCFHSHSKFWEKSSGLNFMVQLKKKVVLFLCWTDIPTSILAWPEIGEYLQYSTVMTLQTDRELQKYSVTTMSTSKTAPSGPDTLISQQSYSKKYFSPSGLAPPFQHIKHTQRSKNKYTVPWWNTGQYELCEFPSLIFISVVQNRLSTIELKLKKMSACLFGIICLPEVTRVLISSAM